jgi:hypothetical protein
MIGTTLLMLAGTAKAALLTGYVGILDASTGASIGYISNTPDAGGLFVTTMDPSKRLEVAFSDVAGPFSMLAFNDSGNATTPFLGGIQGINSSTPNLAIGSGNYAIVVGTAQTLACAKPTPSANSFIPYFDPVSRLRNAESAVWSLSKSGTLSAQWVNSDGSLPRTSIVLSQDILAPAESVLVLTADPAASAVIFGPGPTVVLKFIPADMPAGSPRRKFGWPDSDRACNPSAPYSLPSRTW